MSSGMDLTKEQQKYFIEEGHYGIERCTLALIYKDGTVVLDYPSEIVKVFEREKLKKAKELGEVE